MAMEGLNMKDLLNCKRGYFEVKVDKREEIEEQEEPIDVFSSDFSGFSGSTSSNPYNLSKVIALCEDLVPDGGVKKLLIKRGTGPVVPPDANVTFRFESYTEFDDKPIDSSRSTNLDIGMTTLRGLSIALASMKKHEKANFYIAPSYAYGQQGCPPKIPQNSTCLFIIELLDFEETAGAGEYYDRPSEERSEALYEVIVNVVEVKMKEAKELFGQRKYAKSCQIYENMAYKLKKFEEEEGETEGWKKLMITLRSNAALCCLKLENLEKCIDLADEALDCDPKHVKALYAKGKALRKVGLFEQALALILEAKKVSPKNEDINQELCYLEKYVKISQREEKDLCSKMMKMDIKPSIEDASKSSEGPTDGKSGISQDLSGMLSKEINEYFNKHLIELKESDDLAQEMTLSSDCFSFEELLALEGLAKSHQLKVYWSKLSTANESIKISRQ